MSSRFAAIFLLVCPLAAQEFRGTILGRILDPTGASVPGAVVTITQDETRVAITARSNQEGNYSAPFVLPGRYTVSVEAVGFRKAVREGIIVQVNDRIALDFTLELGATSDVVTVIAESPLLQTASAELGQVVAKQFIDRLPLAGRSVLDFADMAPGVIAEGAGFPGTTGNGQNNITVNGGNGSNRGNDITIDGIPALAPRQLGLAVGVPMSDAVEEFKVVTTMFDASLGRSNGGATAITTRSGTNELHGSAYYYTQKSALNANSWTNNRNGLPKPPLDLNAWGGTVGGPLRRNRTFLFFGFEKDHNGRSAPALARVPTDLERAGDFSQTRAPNGGPLAIYDPSSTVVDANGRFVSRTAFPNARILTLNPVGAAVLSKLPKPTLSVPAQIGLPNWAASMNFTTRVQNWQGRIDQQISNRQRMFVRIAALDHYQSPDPPYFPGAYYVQPNGTQNLNSDNRRQKSLAADDTITFSPSIVGSFRVGVTRLFSFNTMDGDRLDPAELKLPARLLAAQVAPAWPIFDIRADGAPYIGSRPRLSVNDVYTFLANLTKLHGNHNFRFGPDYRMIRWNENNPGEQANGQFIFNNTLTREDPTRSTTGNTSGAAMASLLLGLPATTGNSRIGYTSALSLQNQYLALFFQDDWKLTRRLTLNLGLRYEIETPVTERYNRLLYGFDEAADLKLSAPGVGPLRGGVQFVNVGGLPRHQGLVDANNFGPRAGFAYQATPRTVLRAGYGIFFSSGITNLNSGTPVTDPAFGAITPWVGSSGGDTTPLAGVSLSNPFPNGFVQPTGASLGLATDLGSNVTVQDTRRVLPYVQQWQLGVQRELPAQMLWEVSYVSAHSLRLYEDFNRNEIPDAALRQVSNIANPFLGVLPAPSVLGQGATIRANRLAVRFPHFNNVNLQRSNTGRHLYHSLQARVQKRMSHGVQLTANYTFSKGLLYNAYSVVNERHWRTVSDIDRTHLFRLFVTWEIPAGRNRALGASWPRWMDAAFGAWALTWVTRYTSGHPLGITDTLGRPIPLRNPATPGSVHDRLGDRLDPATGRPLNPYLDPTAFQRLPDFTVTPERSVTAGCAARQASPTTPPCSRLSPSPSAGDSSCAPKSTARSIRRSSPTRAWNFPPPTTSGSSRRRRAPGPSCSEARSGSSPPRAGTWSQICGQVRTQMNTDGIDVDLCCYIPQSSRAEKISGASLGATRHRQFSNPQILNFSIGAARPRGSNLRLRPRHAAFICGSAIIARHPHTVDLNWGMAHAWNRTLRLEIPLLNRRPRPARA